MNRKGHTGLSGQERSPVGIEGPSDRQNALGREQEIRSAI